MGCNGCAQGVNGLPEGCRSNGICSTDGGNKLTVFNWLSDIKLPTDRETFDVVEVRFKNSRKGFYRNSNNLMLNIGDAIAVEASPGHDIGVISLVGELVRVQLRKKGVAEDDPQILKIYRKATQRDIDIWKEARSKEWDTMIGSRNIASRLGLKMKISDIEYQGDNSKAIFYYTAEDRVDFRLLIKELASTFSVRVEMKQIGLRQEAARLGGIGSCGRELCCSTWLTDFRSVTTTAARYQQLSLNPQKLAGQCGKLKCCLNFELDSYLDALKQFPETETTLKTEKGKAYFQKMDIFKGVVWYAYHDEPMNWHPIPVESVNEIIKCNKNNIPVNSLEDFSQSAVAPVKKQVDFHKVVGQDDLNRFDVKKEASKRKANQKRKNRGFKDRDNNSAELPKKEEIREKSAEERQPKPPVADNKPKVEPAKNTTEGDKNSKFKRYSRKPRKFRGKPGSSGKADKN